MGIEDMRRDPAMDFEPVRRGDAQVKPQSDDAENLIERGLVLGGGIVLQPVLEWRRIESLPCRRTADDEWDVEFGLIGIVEPVEPGKLFFR